MPFNDFTRFTSQLVLTGLTRPPSGKGCYTCVTPSFPDQLANNFSIALKLTFDLTTQRVTFTLLVDFGLTDPEPFTSPSKHSRAFIVNVMLPDHTSNFMKLCTPVKQQQEVCIWVLSFARFFTSDSLPITMVIDVLNSTQKKYHWSAYQLRLPVEKFGTAAQTIYDVATPAPFVDVFSSSLRDRYLKIWFGCSSLETKIEQMISLMNMTTLHTITSARRVVEALDFLQATNVASFPLYSLKLR